MLRPAVSQPDSLLRQFAAMSWRVTSMLLHGALLAILCAAAANTTRGQDVITPLQIASPRLRFHTGEVENGQPAILKTLPAIPGTASAWYLAQWQQASYLRPDMLVGGTTGPWRFTAPDGHSVLRIDRQTSRTLYTLTERDGILTVGGGANLFLTTTGVRANSFAAPMILSLDYRLTDASISAYNSAAIASGAVQAMAFTGLGLTFHDQEGHPDRFVFMQLPITISRVVPSGSGVVCTPNSGSPSLLFAPDLKYSPFKVQSAEQHRRYDLSALVHDMLSRPYPCGGAMLNWPEEQKDPAAWHLSVVYVGLEVQNRDLRPTATTHDPQGHSSLGLQLSSFSITQ